MPVVIIIIAILIVLIFLNIKSMNKRKRLWKKGN